MHYPYRVATHYQEFLDRFSSSLTLDQLQEVNKAAEDVSQTIDNLPYQRSKHKYIVECRKAMHYVIGKVKELQLSNEE
jgi:predicted KAP-like P-loop ATPase